MSALSAPFRCGGEAVSLPQRVKILAWGRNEVRPGGQVILVDDQVATSLSANQELVGIDKVPMDYEHQSFPTHRNYMPDPRHSPGSGRIEVVPGDGVYLCGISYTPSGVEHAASYQDVSAVVHHDAEGRPLWISSVALCQAGAVAGMEFSEAAAAALALAAAPSPSPTPTPDTMDQTDDAPNYRELLIAKLGLTPGESGEVTDEQIHAAMSTAKPEAAGTEALSARLTALESLEARREREALVARAAAEGKVIPLTAELIAQTPVAVLSAMVDGLTAGEVPLAGAKTTEKPGSEAVALSADEATAAKALGLTPEEFRKANPQG